MLFLLPSEIGFLRYLKEARVPLNEFGFPENKVANVQSQVSVLSIDHGAHTKATSCVEQLEKLLQKNYYLHESARDGFRSYLQSYASYSLKGIFDVNKLDLTKVAKAFGFSVPPRVNVNIGPDGEADITGALKRTRDEFASDDDSNRDTGWQGFHDKQKSKKKKGASKVA